MVEGELIIFEDKLIDVITTLIDFYIPHKFYECVYSILGSRSGNFLFCELILEILLIKSMLALLYLSSKTILLSTVNRALAKRGYSTLWDSLDIFACSIFPIMACLLF